MQLVERHRINKKSYRGKILDQKLFLSKNLYNSAVYAFRKYYESTKTYLGYHALEKQFSSTDQADHRALPAKVSQQVLMQADEAFRSFFKAIKSYSKNPKKFTGPPKIPGFKHKVNGRNALIFTSQAISRKDLSPSGIKELPLPTKILYKDICQVRIIPGDVYHTVEIVYNKQEKPTVNTNIYAALDPGVTNLATVVTTNSAPLVITGGPLKSINQYYNKKRAELQSKLKGDQKTSKRIRKLTSKRNDKISDYMHKASRYLVNHLVYRGVSKLVIGHNKAWKQETNIGKKNNQNFVYIPHSKFFAMLRYKCALEGIEVVEREESYTSKCSFLDLEKIKKQNKYMGKRVSRGLFISSSGRKINADVNGSYNILRKEIPDAFGNGIEGILVCPMRLKPHKNKPWNKIL
jgi:putative transposase